MFFTSLRFAFFFNLIVFALDTTAQQPAINSVTPAAASAGSTITITGNNFNATAANNNVFFGATKALVTAASTTQLTVNVPFGALHYPVTVSTATGTTYSAQAFLPTFPAGVVNFNNSSFTGAVDAITATSPEAVVLTDLDGDGKTDMVSANSSGNNISIFKNTSTNGTAAFATKTDISGGTAPWGIAAGDINSDGKPDIAITNLAVSPKVSVFINTSNGGTISFAARLEFIAGSTPRGIEINDMDGDGKPDIVFTNNGASSFSVLQNTTSGGTVSFAPKVDFTTGSSPYNISARDIDGDGKADIAVSNQFSNNVSVFRNTSTAGTISFAAKVDFSTANNPRGIACGDIDGDGKADIATGNFGSSNLSVLRNTSTIGTIAFASKVDFALAPLAQTEQIAIGDLNGDGKPDIALPDPYSGNLHVNVFRNTSVSGTVSFATRVIYSTGSFSGPKNIAIGDIDGDGRADMEVVCNGNNKISIFRNIAPPVVNSFTPVTAVAGASITISGYNFRNTAAENIVFFGGTKATVTASSNTSLTVTVPNGATHLPISVTADGLTGHAQLPFVLSFPGGDSIIANSFAARKIFASGNNGYDACIADFDGDGKNDVAIPTYSNSTISIFRNTSTTGNLSFAVPFTVTNFNSSIGAVTAGDLNGDGKAELIAADGENNSVSVYRNTSTPGSISFVTTATGAVVSAIATNVYVADLNEDGRPEIIADTKGYIAIIPNNSTGPSNLTFGTVQLISMDNYLDKIAVADFDGDKKVDIVSGQSYIRNTSVNGVISFSPLTNFATLSAHDYYVTADFNSDGKPDIAELNANQRRIRFYSNTSIVGNISFALQPVTYTTGMYPQRLSAGDLNGDGRPDIAVANVEQDAISVFANASTGSTINFIPKVDYEAGHWPYEVAIGDLDGDAKPDIVTPNWQNQSFSVFRFKIDIVPSNIPEINSFAPLSGQVGDTIIVSGNNFSITATDNIVLFGGVKANVITANNTSLTVQVPVGAAYKPFSVTNANGLTGYAKKIFKITFPGAAASFRPNAFDSAKLFDAADYPWAVYVGDIDGDGKNDVATANYNANSVSVFRNTSVAGTVNFAARADLPVGNVPKACTIADLNADGKPELLVANSSDNTISVFRNTSTPGSISFAAAFTISTDSASFGHPNAIEVYDMDGDGKADVIVANQYSTYVTFFRNITSTVGGTISFGQRVHFGGGYSPSSLAIKDLDGNGKPDVVVGNNGNQVMVLSNTSTVGNIAFTRGENFNPNSNFGVSGIAVIDVNEDNKPDIAMATSNEGLSRYINQSIRGTHFFGDRTDYGPTMTSKGIVADDFDGDGRADMAIPNLFNKTIGVYKNRYTAIDTPHFKASVDYSVLPAPLSPVAIASGDIDGDGKPDMICSVPVNYLVNHLVILRNTVGLPSRLCANGGITFTAALGNAVAYQWQVSTDNGVTFTNINDNANYSGTTTTTLQLSNISSSWTGYQYRCFSSNFETDLYTIRFYNTWTGAVNNQWENPGNWSCGTVPDLFTDVVIEGGATVVLNSNVSIATLNLNPGASFTVNAPFTMTLVGH